MNLLITVEVKVPDDPSPEPQRVVDEITSNLESCDWTVVSAVAEIIDANL